MSLVSRLQGCSACCSLAFGTMTALQYERSQGIDNRVGIATIAGVRQSSIAPGDTTHVENPPEIAIAAAETGKEVNKDLRCAMMHLELSKAQTVTLRPTSE